MTDVERFITAIRNTIETQLAHLIDDYARDEGVILLPNEGASIDLDQLARAIHKTVINHQSPPF